jgi:hypothetical protein
MRAKFTDNKDTLIIPECQLILIFDWQNFNCPNKSLD